MKARHSSLVPVLFLVLGLATSCGGSADPDRALDDGLELQQAGDLEGAAEQYQQVLDARPTDKYANYNLGVIEGSEGRTQLAEAYYRAALDTDPAFVPALFNLAIVRTDVGATQEAMDLYRRVLDARPDDAAAHFNLGILLQAAGRGERGLAELDAALALDPTLAGRLVTRPIGASGQDGPGVGNE